LIAIGQRASNVHLRTTALSSMSENDRNGKERRSGGDRRQSDRRNPERRPAKGVLSTREGERRQSPRRKADRKPPEPTDD
jgi:hypothetical protein